MQVNIYTMSNTKGIKRQNTKVGYVLSTQTSKGEATISGFKELEEVTANQSELLVLILALRRITMPCAIHIYTESTYIAGALKYWVPRWKENNWNGSKGKPIANQKEWIELNELLAKHAYIIHTEECHQYRMWLKNEVKKGA